MATTHASFPRPNGLVIAVLGPDGSGKTTVIDGVRSDFSTLFAETEGMHFRPGLFSRGKTGFKSRNPHSRPLRGRVRSLLKLAYYFIDSVLGYFFLVRPTLARSGLVVFDRYFHDLLVDPKRYRYGGPTWIVKWLVKLVPQPHLFLLLDAPVAVIQSRCQEVSTQEMFRQRIAYRDLASSLEGAFVLDASQDRTTVIRQAKALILDYIAGETDSRLREVIASANTPNHPTQDS